MHAFDALQALWVKERYLKRDGALLCDRPTGLKTGLKE
jgi:hypothetical protein